MDGTKKLNFEILPSILAFFRHIVKHILGQKPLETKTPILWAHFKKIMSLAPLGRILRPPENFVHVSTTEICDSRDFGGKIVEAPKTINREV